MQIGMVRAVGARPGSTVPAPAERCGSTRCKAATLTALVSTGLAFAGASPLSSLGWQDSLLAAPLAAGSVATAQLLRRRVNLEWHNGNLHVQFINDGSQLAAGAVEVLPTTDGRGNGAFATQYIPFGTHICDYEGDALSCAEFAERYPDGVSDYVIGVDESLALDASHLVRQTDRFCAVHMNHSGTDPNVRFVYIGRRVAYFAVRDIAPGEELCYDYGPEYWTGREHLEVS